MELSQRQIEVDEVAAGCGSDSSRWRSRIVPDKERVLREEDRLSQCIDLSTYQEYNGREIPTRADSLRNSSVPYTSRTSRSSAKINSVQILNKKIYLTHVPKNCG